MIKTYRIIKLDVGPLELHEIPAYMERMISKIPKEDSDIEQFFIPVRGATDVITITKQVDVDTETGIIHSSEYPDKIITLEDMKLIDYLREALPWHRE